MTAIYNEIDPRAAQWLRELVKAGLIEGGEVNETDIRNLSPTDLQGFNRVHLFAGIGGWDYALQLAGWPADFPVWTGSCPCQPFSTAGRRKAETDPRHLWPEMQRLIAHGQPAVVFGEQVASKAGRAWLDRVRADLEAMGYAVGAADLCAAGKGAPHIRQRLFWVGVTEGGARGLSERQGQAVPDDKRASEACRLVNTEHQNRRAGIEGEQSEEGRGRHRPADPSEAGGLGDARSSGCRKQRRPEPVEAQQLAAERAGGIDAWGSFEIVQCADGKARRFEPGSFPLADGIPGRVGLLRGYGNAIVPQVAAEFIAAFLESVSV